MLVHNNDVLENIDEGNLTKELEIAKFRNYGRENFSDLICYKVTFDSFIKNSSQFYSISLPKDISDYFIRFDLAPYFFMSDAPLLQSIEDLLITNKSEFNFVSNYREIKNFYYKWLVQKNAKEKTYYANSIINSVERNYNFQSFYNLMIYGTVLTFDPVVFNAKRAVELFDRAKELVNKFNINDDLRQNILYTINIYKGFVHLKEYEYSNSLKAFQEALNHEQYGVTAYFYCALSARYIDDFDMSYDYMRDVLEFDKARFNYAINLNHLTLFEFFYKNSVFYNIFTESGFAPLLPDIDFLIRSLFSGEANSMELTYSKLINLDNLPIKDFYSKEVLNEIKFLKKALDHYKNKKTGLIRIVEQIFRDKLITLIEYIRNLIESHYYDQIKEEINVFDNQIEQNKRQLTRIKHEMEDAHKKIKINLDEAAEYLEETITEKSKFLEEKIKNLEKSNRFNPSHVLYNSMIFTLFISFIVFSIISIITSIVGFGGEAASNHLALRTGVRWSGVTFAVGVFISIFSTFTTFWEKASEKKVLMSQLNRIKEMESLEREEIKEDSELRIKVYEQKFKDRIATQEKIIQNFIQERDQNYKQKYELAKKEIDEYIYPLNELLNALSNAG